MEGKRSCKSRANIGNSGPRLQRLSHRDAVNTYHPPPSCSFGSSVWTAVVKAASNSSVGTFKGWKSDKRVICCHGRVYFMRINCTKFVCRLVDSTHARTMNDRHATSRPACVCPSGRPSIQPRVLSVPD